MTSCHVTVKIKSTTLALLISSCFNVFTCIVKQRYILSPFHRNFLTQKKLYSYLLKMQRRVKYWKSFWSSLQDSKTQIIKLTWIFQTLQVKNEQWKQKLKHSSVLRPNFIEENRKIWIQILTIIFVSEKKLKLYRNLYQDQTFKSGMYITSYTQHTCIMSQSYQHILHTSLRHTMLLNE